MLAVAQAADPPNVVDLESWSPAAFEDGIRAGSIIGIMDVVGPDGEDVGEVEDILIDPDGVARFVVVETDAFLDIGDTHARVAWEDIDLGVEDARVNLTEDMLEQRPDVDDAEFAQFWRANELIGDRVDLTDVVGYGTVNDIVFEEDGQIAAVVVLPEARYGYGRPGGYAYPYYGRDYGWGPESAYYGIPYTWEQIEGWQEGQG